MLVLPADANRVVDTIRELVKEKNHGEVLMLVDGSSVDSVSAALIVRRLLRADDVRHGMHPVWGFHGLTQVYDDMVVKNSKVRPVSARMPCPDAAVLRLFPPDGERPSERCAV